MDHNSFGCNWAGSPHRMRERNEDYSNCHNNDFSIRFGNGNASFEIHNVIFNSDSKVYKKVMFYIQQFNLYYSAF